MAAARSYTEAEVLALIADLTDARLQVWTRHRIIRPMVVEGAARYRDLDIARLRTLIDLDDSFDLAPDALGMVMALVDQVHVIRSDMEALVEALAAEPAELRARIRAAINARTARED